MNPANQEHIDLRTGLPEHLQKLAKIYPREVWQNHHNFNELTRFWLSRHAMFREIISRLMADTLKILEARPDENQSIGFKTTTARLTDFLLSQLHEHHMIEDHHYFPMLKPFDADFEAGFQLLEQDHHELDKNIHLLAAQTERLITGLNAQQNILELADQILNAQKGFEKFLNRHLLDEEDLIVPIILEYGGPEIDGAF